MRTPAFIVSPTWPPDPLADLQYENARLLQQNSILLYRVKVARRAAAKAYMRHRRSLSLLQALQARQAKI